MNPTIANLIAVLTFFVGSLILFVLGRRLLRGQSRQTAPSRERPLAFGRMTHELAAMLPLHFERRQALERDLRRAGYYHRHARDEFLAFRNVAFFGWVLLTGVTVIVALEPGRDYTMPILAVGAAVAIILFSVPRLILQAQAASRLRQIQHSLPDALDMLTMTMMGGAPLQQALGHVSREIGVTYPVLSSELTIIQRHIETGSLDQALRGFADRIDLPDVQSLAALVLQTEQLGTNVARALQDYSDSVRRSRLQRAETRGNRTSVAMILPIVLCLSPPIYILLLGPALLELRSFVVQGTQAGGVLRPDTSELDSVPLSGNE